MVDRNRRNYYRILHVQPDAPYEIIKSSYRALMLSLEMHPDYGGEHWNAALINEAYEVLSNPHRRADYDREAKVAFGASRSAEPAEAEPHRCVFCGLEYRALVRNGARCTRCRSPLSPLEKLRLSESDGRSVDRVPLHGRLDYFTTWPQSRASLGLLEDMSPNGVRFAGDAMVEEHRIIKIESGIISATARVVYCRVGAGFGELPCTIGADFYTLEFRNVSGTFLSERA